MRSLPEKSAMVPVPRAARRLFAGLRGANIPALDERWIAAAKAEASRRNAAGEDVSWIDCLGSTPPRR